MGLFASVIKRPLKGRISRKFLPHTVGAEKIKIKKKKNSVGKRMDCGPKEKHKSIGTTVGCKCQRPLLKWHSGSWNAGKDIFPPLRLNSAVPLRPLLEVSEPLLMPLFMSFLAVCLSVVKSHEFFYLEPFFLPFCFISTHYFSLHPHSLRPLCDFVFRVVFPAIQHRFSLKKRWKSTYAMCYL